MHECPKFCEWYLCSSIFMLALWKSCLGKGQANTVGWVRSDFCLLKPGTAGLVSCGFSMIMCLQVIHFQKQLRLAQPYLQISIFNEKILASMLSHRSQSTQLLLRASCHRWMESGKKLRQLCCTSSQDTQYKSTWETLETSKEFLFNSFRSLESLGAHFGRSLGYTWRFPGMLLNNCKLAQGNYFQGDEETKS